MTCRFIRTQNEEMWSEYQESWTLRAVHVSFILEARGRSRAETYDVQEMDKRTRLSL